MNNDDTRIDPDEHRDVLLPVIERWFPDDDAPYHRVDELLQAARIGGFEPGVKTWAVDWWTERVADAEAHRDRLVEALEDMKDFVSGDTHRQVVKERDMLRAQLERIGRVARNEYNEEELWQLQHGIDPDGDVADG